MAAGASTDEGGGWLAELPPSERLQLLVLDDDDRRWGAVAALARRLGHGVLQAPPADVVLVAPGEGALDTIAALALEGGTPVVAIAADSAPGFLVAAVRRGAAGCIAGLDPELTHATLLAVRRRHADERRLAAASDRRALVEQATGILMARHALEAGPAAELLTAHAQRLHRKPVDVARSVAQTHLLLPTSDDPTPIAELDDALLSALARDLDARGSGTPSA